MDYNNHKRTAYRTPTAIAIQAKSAYSTNQATHRRIKPCEYGGLVSPTKKEAELIFQAVKAIVEYYRREAKKASRNDSKKYLRGNSRKSLATVQSSAQETAKKWDTGALSL